VNELEDGFDVGADEFAEWKSSGFIIPPRNKDDFGHIHEYPSDHYLTLVRKSFVLDEGDIGSYKTFLDYVAAATEDFDSVQLAQPFETFREMRQKDKVCQKIMSNIIGWLRCAHISFDNLKDKQESFTFVGLLKQIEEKINTWLHNYDKDHIGIICTEVSCVQNWKNVLQVDFFEIVNLFKAIHQHKLVEFITPKLNA